MRASPVTLVKIRLPKKETRVQSLSGEEPLGKEMATHSSILAWRSPWSEEPGLLQSKGLERVEHGERSITHAHTGLPNIPENCNFSTALS